MNSILLCREAKSKETFARGFLKVRTFLGQTVIAYSHVKDFEIKSLRTGARTTNILRSEAIKVGVKCHISARQRGRINPNHTDFFNTNTSKYSSVSFAFFPKQK